MPGKRKLIDVYKRQDYYYNLQLTQQSQLNGKKIINRRIEGLPGFEVYSLTRNDKILYPHEKHLSIQPGDELLVTGNSERLSYILNHKEVKLKGIEFLSHEKRENLKQYEAVLSPRFPWLGPVSYTHLAS